MSEQKTELEARPSKGEIEAMARLNRTEPIAFTLDCMPCLQLIALLQLALRHPEAAGPAAQVATGIAWALRDQLVEREPGIAPMIDRGWNVIPPNRRN
jgi:hypothetical protein